MKQTKPYMRSIYLSVFLGIMLYGCGTPEFLTKEELQAYVMEPEHGLVQEKKVGSLKLQVIYRPTDLLVAQEMNLEQDTAQVKTLRKKYEKYAYFILKLSAQNKDALHQNKSFSEFSDLLQTLAYRMNDYVELTSSEQDTIPVGDYTYPRMYGYATSSLLFAFSKKEFENDEWIQFNLKEFGLGSGIHKFRFNKEDIERVPALSFKKI